MNKSLVPTSNYRKTYRCTRFSITVGGEVNLITDGGISTNKVILGTHRTTGRCNRRMPRTSGTPRCRRTRNHPGGTRRNSNRYTETKKIAICGRDITRKRPTGPRQAPIATATVTRKPMTLPEREIVSAFVSILRTKTYFVGETPVSIDGFTWA